MGLIFAIGPAWASAIADALLMDKSQLSRLIKDLSGRGLLHSAKAPDDGRAVQVSLTTGGIELHDRFLAEVIAGNERILAVLDRQEVDQLLQLIARLTDHTGTMLAQREGQAIQDHDAREG